MLTLAIPTNLLTFQNNQTIGAQKVRDGSATVTVPRVGATVRQVAEITDSAVISRAKLQPIILLVTLSCQIDK
jgi:hypothetical protein